MTALQAIDAAIVRARASAGRMEQAARNSIRSGQGRQQQRVAADQATAYLEGLIETRARLAELIEACDEYFRVPGLYGPDRCIEALAHLGAPE